MDWARRIKLGVEQKVSPHKIPTLPSTLVPVFWKYWTPPNTTGQPAHKAKAGGLEFTVEWEDTTMTVLTMSQEERVREEYL